MQAAARAGPSRIPRKITKPFVSQSHRPERNDGIFRVVLISTGSVASVRVPNIIGALSRVSFFPCTSNPRPIYSGFSECEADILQGSKYRGPNRCYPTVIAFLLTRCRRHCCTGVITQCRRERSGDGARYWRQDMDRPRRVVGELDVPHQADSAAVDWTGYMTDLHRTGKTWATRSCISS